MSSGKASTTGPGRPEVATWNARTQRLFAADCAESVLHLIATAGQDDTAARRAIEVARLHADHKATDAELSAAWDAARDAAKDAAWDAARDAAWDAARAAARQWQRARLLAYLNGEIA